MDFFQTCNGDSSSDLPSTMGLGMRVSQHENEIVLSQTITFRGFNGFFPNLQ